MRARGTDRSICVRVEVCQEVGEIGDCRSRNRGHCFGHRRLIAWPLAALVLAQRLREVVLALPREARHLVPTAEVAKMAGAATMLAGERRAARVGLGSGSVWGGAGSNPAKCSDSCCSSASERPCANGVITVPGRRFSRNRNSWTV